ncbi:uncharacterized protein LOC129319381 isoform X2 [Prosopis cineraria]|uniref:uncharacterized protein LOC129319381 isoform X2 n=1 Tax=Prosopis cineraria TaxID=364024 RepID=UPI00240F6AA4|nr:uncharacterized protein LOC129319381 isoform X2 [Prosopis cineraria]
MALAIRQFLYLTRFNPHVSFSPTSLVSPMPNCQNHRSCALRNRNQTVIAAPVVKASAGNDSLTVDGDDGVSLGTMVLPMDTDLKRFESLLFQVDKIPGGARLGFITVADGKTEVLVYIDCLVFPATDNSAPMFRAIRNGLLKGKDPPGEPRIMRSLLQALKKSVEIARS